jgi:hypothetical protein
MDLMPGSSVHIRSASVELGLVDCAVVCMGDTPKHNEAPEGMQQRCHTQHHQCRQQRAAVGNTTSFQIRERPS